MATKFNYNKLKIKRTDRLNEIIKSTKDMIINSAKFNTYLNEYINAVQIPAFKTPEITCYPILKNFFLIPLNKMHYYEEEQKQRQKGSNRPISCLKIHKAIMPGHPLPNLSTSRDLFNKNSTIVSNTINSSKKMTRVKSAACVSFTHKEKSLNRDNSNFRRECLINAFFPDWCFNDLVYEESLIFNREAYYRKFINEKMNYIKDSNIENMTSVINSKFNKDSNREMLMTLSSMKIEFVNKSNEKKKATVIYLPFAYLFLFYFKGIKYFQQILLGIIKFNDNDQIILDEQCLYDVLRSNPSLLNLNTNTTAEENPMNNKQIDTNSNAKAKHHISKRESGEHQSIGLLPKTEIRHMNSLSQNAYNNYSFTWLALNEIYQINISLPEVFIKLKQTQVNVIRYIDKELILFLLEKNFINWDFYVINFLFSLKNFRIFIEKMLSKKHSILASPSTLIKKKSSANLSIKKVTIANMIELSPFKVHDFSLQDYSFSYFYSNENEKNSLHVLHSYSVSVFFSKIKPIKKFVFDFTFKQMFILNKILIQTRNLEAFIMKILITDSSIGVIQLNYAFFEHFNEEIFKDEEKYDINDKGNKTNIKGIEILIDKPYLIRIYSDTPYRSNDIPTMHISNDIISDLERKDLTVWPMILMNQSNYEPIINCNENKRKSSKFSQGQSLSSNNLIDGSGRKINSHNSHKK